MQAEGVEWGENYGQGARDAVPAPNPTGASALLAALPTAVPHIAVQRRWAHKINKVLAKVRKPDPVAVKAGLHRT